MKLVEVTFYITINHLMSVAAMVFKYLAHWYLSGFILLLIV